MRDTKVKKPLGLIGGGVTSALFAKRRMEK